MKFKKSLVGVGACIVFAIYAYTELKPNVPLPAQEEVSFARCVDGDTARLMIDGKEEVVRFLAVDTPETVKPGTPVQPFGKEASDYTCSILTNAKELTLEYEPSNLKDNYDRTLAWVWADGVLLQQQLVSQGLAEVKYIYGDYQYTDMLYEVQNQAKAEERGVWSK